jgi:hypothetical protein
MFPAPTRRKGFVLVFTLFAISLSFLVLVLVAQTSLQRASRTIDRQRDLQSRWGMLSCQRFAFENRNVLLSETFPSDNPQSKSVTRYFKDFVIRVELGNSTAEILVSEESAKANVNTIYQNVSDNQTEEILAEVSGSRAQLIHLRPIPDEYKSSPHAGVFDSFDQVFDVSSENRLSPNGMKLATKNLTCWSARLNVRTASDQAIKVILKPVIGPIFAERIVQARSNLPDASVDEILNEAGVSNEQNNRARRLLSDSADAHSVWVHFSDARRERYSFTVRRQFTDSIVRYYTFYW